MIRDPEPNTVFRAKVVNSEPSRMRDRPSGTGHPFQVFGENKVQRVFVTTDVLDELRRRCMSALPNETIGLLAGTIAHDEFGHYTVVRDLEEAGPDEQRGSPSFVQITADGSAATRHRLLSRNPNLKLVGWWHSHPTFLPNYSGEDRKEQSTYGDDQIGIVVSGLDLAADRRFGVYLGPDSTRMEPLPDERAKDVSVFQRKKVIASPEQSGLQGLVIPRLQSPAVVPPPNIELPRTHTRSLPRHWIKRPRWPLAAGLLACLVVAFSLVWRGSSSPSEQPFDALDRDVVIIPAPTASTPTFHPETTPAIRPPTVVKDELLTDPSVLSESSSRNTAESNPVVRPDAVRHPHRRKRRITRSNRKPKSNRDVRHARSAKRIKNASRGKKAHSPEVSKSGAVPTTTTEATKAAQVRDKANDGNLQPKAKEGSPKKNPKETGISTGGGPSTPK